MRMVLLACLVLLAMPIAAWADGWVYIYQDGVPVGFAVGNDFEFYYVEAADRDQANKELMQELLGYGPHTATVGYGASGKGDDSSAAEQYKPRPDGFSASGVSVRDYLSPGDWKAIYGDWYGTRSWYTEIDKSGVHWSWDSTSFDTAGHVFGLDDNDDKSDKFLVGDRERYMTEAVWRRGSMEGSVFNIRGLTYEVNMRNAGEQPVDVKLKRMQTDFRSVEHGYTIEGAAFGGKYISNRLGMDNTFYGGSLEAGHWITPSVGLSADGTLTQFEIGGTDASVTRSNWGGEVVLQDKGLSLTGFTRSWNEDTSLAANSHLRGYDDLGAKLEYRPSGDAYFSAGYRKREVQYERLRLEDPDIYDAFYGGAEPSRDEWAKFREPRNASSDRLDAAARVELAERLYLGASYSRDDWDSLPEIGSINLGATVPSYFADKRTTKSAQLSYDMLCNGRLTVRTEELERASGVRDSSFSRVCHALNYSAALCRNTRLGLGASRSETTLDLAGETPGWDAASWSYDLSLAGEAGIGDYRVSYRRNEVDGASGGDYDSLGLEFTFDELPISLSAWWRERQDALGGAGSFDDAGLNVGYYIEVR